ncbi:hypothetical protein JCM24511_02261 [Saitozyma sp. JCM 24511]|nr:hypothetical protein JCM24511_02261 [Saitozyma sp. JCM 24511]
MSRRRQFPFPIAVFDDRFIFTTLERRDVSAHARNPYTHPKTGEIVRLFSLDEDMGYIPFADDFGPLNLAYTFDACVAIHAKLEEDKLRPMCLYTSIDVKVKTNMALIAALYFLIVRGFTPAQAFRPIAAMALVYFRDASNMEFDHGLAIQDCLYGVYKAIKSGLLGLSDFDATFYRYYETVQNGDLNLLGRFIPFASPIEEAWGRWHQAATKAASEENTRQTTPRKPTVLSPFSDLPHGFQRVLHVFRGENVGVVIRLNDELYDRRHFLEIGIEHVEMYFDDGSNPTDEIVRDFIHLAEEVIERRGQKVAVHCKAGLGRTGVLVGAYLIYKYHFSAQEVIGFMRIVRPGMVVGPQQQYMLENQMKWVSWAARDQLLREIAEKANANEPVNPLATPPLEPDALLPSSSPSLLPGAVSTAVDQIDPQSRRERSFGTPVPQNVSPKRGDAVGQPRKTPKTIRTEAYVEVDTPEAMEIVVQPASPSPVSHRVAGLGIQRASRTPATEAEVSAPESMRGIKRGATRLPLPQSSQASQSTQTTPSSFGQRDSSSSRAALAVPTPVLARRKQTSLSLSRSSSTASVASQNDRPTKRRSPVPALSSPLSNTGLSSPPPSRESSPADMPIDESPINPSPLLRTPRVPNKLQRKPSPSPAPRIDRSSPAAGVLSSPPPEAAPVSSAVSVLATASKVIPQRSFLPVRRSPMRQMPSVVPVNHQPASPVRVPAGRSTSGPSASKIPVPDKTSTPRKDRRVAGVLTPPKFAMDMLGSITRLANSPQAGKRGFGSQVDAIS